MLPNAGQIDGVFVPALNTAMVLYQIIYDTGLLTKRLGNIWQSRVSALPWNNSWQPVTKPMPMKKPNKHACVTSLLLLICGCQSNSTSPPQLVVPTPAA